MKSINCIVRLENDKPIIFWYEVHSREYASGIAKRVILSCFNHAEGHNEACIEYMRSLKPCPSELASEFVSWYNYNVLDTNDIPNKLCKRLMGPKL